MKIKEAKLVVLKDFSKSVPQTIGSWEKMENERNESDSTQCMWDGVSEP